MSKISNAKIDKTGISLSLGEFKTDEERVHAEEIFNQYRKDHLQPLTECTLELQNWLTGYGSKYCIAQRLKRKPQILRKLKRLSVRLTQLQDIGGCRIIVDNNRDVDAFRDFIKSKMDQDSRFKLFKLTDYRQLGRDDTGYRSLHFIVVHSGHKIELQIRSRIQHSWAESIERASVIYGHHLKEKEGDAVVINYFKELSDSFFEIECGRDPTLNRKVRLDQIRDAAELIIRASDSNKVFDSYINEDIIKTLTQIEKSRGGKGFNNWIIIFDWNSGSFVDWQVVERSPDKAIKAYVEKENQFPAQDGFEVVLIGSSDVATVRETHSHYFGINLKERVLDGLEGTIAGFTSRSAIDSDARKILLCLIRHKYWGKRAVSMSTLKNHYCSSSLTFESSLISLKEKGLIQMQTRSGPISLKVDMKSKIEFYM